MQHVVIVVPVCFIARLVGCTRKPASDDVTQDDVIRSLNASAGYQVSLDCNKSTVPRRCFTFPLLSNRRHGYVRRLGGQRQAERVAGNGRKLSVFVDYLGLRSSLRIHTAQQTVVESSVCPQNCKFTQRFQGLLSFVSPCVFHCSLLPERITLPRTGREKGTSNMKAMRLPAEPANISS